METVSELEGQSLDIQKREWQIRPLAWGVAVIVLLLSLFGLLGATEQILRASALYFALLVIFRLAGKHTLAGITSFDFVLLLIIGEAADQAILGKDSSLSSAVMVMLTLVTLDQIMTSLKHRYSALRDIVDGTPLMLIKNGELLSDRLNREYIEPGDILSAAREHCGIENLSQIQHAVLETHGAISVVPKSNHPDHDSES